MYRQSASEKWQSNAGILRNYGSATDDPRLSRGLVLRLPGRYFGVQNIEHVA
jgi:hypothetical protein